MQRSVSVLSFVFTLSDKLTQKQRHNDLHRTRQREPLGRFPVRDPHQVHSISMDADDIEACLSSDPDIQDIMEILVYIISRKDLARGIKSLLVFNAILEGFHERKNVHLQNSPSLLYSIGSGSTVGDLNADHICAYFERALFPIFKNFTRKALFAGHTHLRRLRVTYDALCARLNERGTIEGIASDQLTILNCVFGPTKPPLRGTPEADHLSDNARLSFYEMGLTKIVGFF